MTEKLRLPQRRPIENSIKIVSPKKEKIYTQENFQIGVIVGIISAVILTLFSLMIIGLLGAIFS